MAVSADATPERIARLRALGVREYLTKPFEIAALLAVVDGMASRDDDEPVRSERS